MNSSGNCLSWFAIHVKPRYERIVATALENKGFETFLPLYRSRRRWWDRVREIEFPLFPGYLFCRLDVAKRLPVLMTPGVLLIIGAGKVPVAVRDEEIAAVKAITGSGLVMCPWPYLESGHPVWIERGLLAGIRGILVSASKRHRLVVSVTLLQRSVAVEISPDWIRPIRPARMPARLAACVAPMARPAAAS